MNRGHPYNEKNLAENIRSAMERIEGLGIVYPEGYYEELCRRYNLTNVPYPFIVRHVGNPRIVRHFLYSEILKRDGELLDYGCGTGDALRQLIRDGYPRERIHGFDVNGGSILLGADLYLDHKEIEGLVSVSPAFAPVACMYDIVYSGSVVHVIEDEDEFRTYLNNANIILKPGGTLFGSTLGLDDSQKERGRHGPPRLMHKNELEDYFRAAGFCNIKIIQDMNHGTERQDSHISLFQFSAQK